MSNISIPLRQMAQRNLTQLQSDVERLASSGELNVRLDIHGHEVVIAGMTGSLLDASRKNPALRRLIQLYAERATFESARKIVESEPEAADKAYVELLVRLAPASDFEVWRLFKAEDERQRLAAMLPSVLSRRELGVEEPAESSAVGSDWAQHYEVLTATIHHDLEYVYLRMCVPIAHQSIKGFVETVEVECVEYAKSRSIGFATVSSHANWDARHGAETKIRVLGAKRASSRLEALAMHQAIRTLGVLSEAGLLNEPSMAEILSGHAVVARSRHPGLAAQLEQEMASTRKTGRKGILSLIGR